MRLLVAILMMLCCAVAHGQALSLADPAKPWQESSLGPADVTGLVLWYKPESLSGANGTAISTWTDSSANGWDMTNAVAGKQPYITNNVANGYAAAYFDGTDFLFAEGGALASWNNVSGATLIAVLKTNSVAGAVLFVSRNSLGSSRFYIYASSGKPTLGGRRLDTDSFQTLGSTDVYSSGFLSHEGWVDYSNSDASVYTNGTLAASTSTFQTSGNTSATDSLNISMGGINTTPSEPFTGWITEAIFYNRAISSGDRAIITAYLEAKYGL